LSPGPHCNIRRTGRNPIKNRHKKQGGLLISSGHYGLEVTRQNELALGTPPGKARSRECRKCCKFWGGQNTGSTGNGQSHLKNNRRGGSNQRTSFISKSQANRLYTNHIGRNICQPDDASRGDLGEVDGFPPCGEMGRQRSKHGAEIGMSN